MHTLFWFLHTNYYNTRYCLLVLGSFCWIGIPLFILSFLYYSYYCIVNRYGGGPEIIRDLVKSFSFTNPLEADLYFLEVTLIRSSNLDEVIPARYKRSTTLGQLKATVSFRGKASGTREGGGSEIERV